MANRVLPTLFIVVVIRESLHDELVDTVQGDLSLGSILNCHGDEGNIRIRRFLVLLPFVKLGKDAKRVTLSAKIRCWIAHAG